MKSPPQVPLGRLGVIYTAMILASMPRINGTVTTAMALLLE
jgi:hypothetical protein